MQIAILIFFKWAIWDFLIVYLIFICISAYNANFWTDNLFVKGDYKSPSHPFLWKILRTPLTGGIQYYGSGSVLR